MYHISLSVVVSSNPLGHGFGIGDEVVDPVIGSNVPHAEIMDDRRNDVTGENSQSLGGKI